MKPVALLLLLALATPFLALLRSEQDPSQTDWSAEVEKACTSRRFMLRIAVAKKVAKAGAAAMPAIAAWAEKNGPNSLPAELVDAIAKDGTTDDAVVDQLLGWATDRMFFWRANAFLGLADRARLLPGRRDRLVALVTEYRDDPAYLVRTYSRLGLHLLDTGDRSPREDDDPRIASKLAALLLDRGLVPPLQPLLDALADERTFQSVSWGGLMAQEAHKALRRALGDEHPMANGEAIEDKTAAIAAVRVAIARKWGQELELPARRTDPEIDFSGGIEVQSCRNGDVHLQWTADGRLYAGLEARFLVQLSAPAWQVLEEQRRALALDQGYGVLICDNLRLRWQEPAVHSWIAPESLPPAVQGWLEKLALALQDADKPHPSSALRAAIDQFAAR